MERLEASRGRARSPSCSTRCSRRTARHHPWLTTEPSPKSILREMLESGDSFATFVRRYRLERSEGLVLRYLTDAWRTLDRSLPDDVYTAALEDVVEWLGELIRATDATLLDEWTLLAGRPVHDHLAPEAPAAVRAVPAGGVAHRGADRRVRLGRPAGRPCATPPWPSAAGGARTTCGGDGAVLGRSTTPSGIDADARSAPWFDLAEEPTRWVVTQRLARPGRRRRVALRRRPSTSSSPTPRAPPPSTSSSSAPLLTRGQGAGGQPGTPSSSSTPAELRKLLTVR